MATIDFSDLVIPTPAAFDADNPTKQAENLAYVKLQIYAKMKTAGFTQSDTAAQDVVDAIDHISMDIALEAGDVNIRMTTTGAAIATS